MIASALPASFQRAASLFLCLAAFVVAATADLHAQATINLKNVASFNGATGSAPDQPLIFGRDGNLYGTAPSGGANELGTFYRVGPNGLITLIYRFGDNDGAYFPNSPLVQGVDGAFYGTAAAPTTSTDQTAKAVYRVDTVGGFNLLHTFPGNNLGGSNLVPGLSVGGDGTLYGVTRNNGNTTTANPAGDGTIFRLTTDGGFTTIYNFNFNRDGFGGSEPNVPLVLGSDGSFYGMTLLGGNFGVGSIYKLSLNGQTTVTTVYNFNSNDGNTPLGALVEGSPGNFYGLTSAGLSGQGGFFRITSNGTFTLLHTFSASEFGFSGQTGRPQSGLLKGADGNFYLTVQGSGTTPDHILQLTPAGGVATFFQLGSNAPGTTLAGGLVQARDGSFYGTTVQGGTSNDGTVFQLTSLPYPAFFVGSIDLANRVKYLAFPNNGNIFGYYSFLSDPHYIFHQDLGYEYVFDAQDGLGGVYLYDFATSDFFYTSPVFPFPYLYSFQLNTVLYYYPDPRRPGRYNTNEVRYFYDFAIGKVIEYPPL